MVTISFNGGSENKALESLNTTYPRDARCGSLSTIARKCILLCLTVYSGVAEAKLLQLGGHWLEFRHVCAVCLPTLKPSARKALWLIVQAKFKIDSMQINEQREG